MMLNKNEIFEKEIKYFKVNNILKEFYLDKERVELFIIWKIKEEIKLINASTIFNMCKDENEVRNIEYILLDWIFGKNFSILKNSNCIITVFSFFEKLFNYKISKKELRMMKEKLKLKEYIFNWYIDGLLKIDKKIEEINKVDKKKITFTPFDFGLSFSYDLRREVKDISKAYNPDVFFEIINKDYDFSSINYVIESEKERQKDRDIIEKKKPLFKEHTSSLIKG